MTEQPDITTTMQADNLRTWLELEVLKLGTADQRRLHMECGISEDELTGLARHELFKELHGERRWAGRDRVDLVARNVSHVYKPGDDLDAVHDGYDFESAEVDVLTVAELRTLRRLEAFAEKTRRHPWVAPGGGGVTITTTSHWATCRVCLAEHCRSSAKITIEWAGRLLTREYAL